MKVVSIFMMRGLRASYVLSNTAVGLMPVQSEYEGVRRDRIDLEPVI